MKSLKQIRIDLDTLSDDLYHEVSGESKLANKLADLSSDIEKHIQNLNEMTKL